MLEKYPNDVKIVIKHFPLNSHRFAMPAAMAAMAAGIQGKFWEFHKALLRNYNAINDAKIQSIAGKLKLDMERFNEDRKSPENRAHIKEDINDGRRIGVRGTPTVYINGKKVKSDPLRRVAEELASLKKSAEK